MRKARAGPLNGVDAGTRTRAEIVLRETRAGALCRTSKIACVRREGTGRTASVRRAAGTGGRMKSAAGVTTGKSSTAMKSAHVASATMKASACCVKTTAMTSGVPSTAVTAPAPSVATAAVTTAAAACPCHRRRKNQCRQQHAQFEKS